MNCTHPLCPPKRIRPRRPYRAAYRVVLNLRSEGSSAVLAVASDHAVCRWHRFAGCMGSHDVPRCAGIHDLLDRDELAWIAGELGLPIDWRASWVSYEPLEG